MRRHEVEVLDGHSCLPLLPPRERHLAPTSVREYSTVRLDIAFFHFSQVFLHRYLELGDRGVLHRRGRTPLRERQTPRPLPTPAPGQNLWYNHVVRFVRGPKKKIVEPSP